VVNGAPEINVHREAAWQPAWFGGIAFLLWERACSRKRWVNLRWCWMCWRLREQARSHKFCIVRGCC